MDGSEAFDYLIVGLAEFFNQDARYPYPDLLSHACHKLALEMTATPYPRTLNGFMKLLEQPVRTWYPLSVPSEFDSDFGLTYERELSEEANRYLYDELLERSQQLESAPTYVKQIALENLQFYRLLERLRESSQNDPDRTQQEYVLLRRFLIENPYTTTDRLRTVFSTTRYLSIREVGDLYEDVRNSRCWCCDRCGPLTEKHGQLRGIKPSICNDHRKDLLYVREIAWQRGLRRIKDGIHWRVCLPGIPEINLFNALKDLQEDYSEQLCAVHLYPGVDRYDLQLRFSDGAVWAVDMKDHRAPYRLAPELTLLYREGDLRYDEGFYVIPIHRLKQREDYIEILREEAPTSSAHILSDETFNTRAADKLEALKKGR